MFFVQQIGRDYNRYTNPHDTQTCWIFPSEDPGDTPILPSPYLNDGSKNPIYHNEYFVFDDEKNYNALANLDGKGDTAKIYEIVGDSDYAASYCYFHETEGTTQGDWYLPSVGELGYLFARARRIDESLKAINADFNVSYLVSVWSSSEVNAECAWSGFPFYGRFEGDRKKNEIVTCAVPFCEVEM